MDPEAVREKASRIDCRRMTMFSRLSRCPMRLISRAFQCTFICKDSPRYRPSRTQASPVFSEPCRSRAAGDQAGSCRYACRGLFRPCGNAQSWDKTVSFRNWARVLDFNNGSGNYTLLSVSRENGLNPQRFESKAAANVTLDRDIPLRPT